MPRFFFHIEREGELITDEEGSEAPSVEAARQVAIRAATDLAADDLRTGAQYVSQRIIVAEEGGNDLLAVAVEALLRIEEPVRRIASG